MRLEWREAFLVICLLLCAVCSVCIIYILFLFQPCTVTVNILPYLYRHIGAPLTPSADPKKNISKNGGELAVRGEAVRELYIPCSAYRMRWT